MLENVLTKEEKAAMAEEQMHKDNNLWKEVAVAYGDAQKKLFDDTIKFIYQALTAMGIIAGFGFAGIQGVQNTTFFFLGESLMFASIMFGFYKIKDIYVKNTDSIDKASDAAKKLFYKSAKTLASIRDEILEKGELQSQEKADTYAQTNLDIANHFGVNKIEKNAKKKDESGFITIMIVLFSIGFFFLLLSFVNFDKHSSRKEFRQKHHRIYGNYQAGTYR